jgi:parallel beta-helix repeat protein
MNTKRKIVTILLSTLLVSFLAAYIPQTMTNQGMLLRGAEQKETESNIPSPTTDRILSGTVHDPIYIDGDDDFHANATAEEWAGDGSVGNPYIIDGYDIDLGESAGHCIHIANTQVYFTISNCFLTGATDKSGAGIFLDNVQHANIMKNTIVNNYYGIHFSHSGNNTIAGNTWHDSTSNGARLDDSDSNNLANNTCHSNIYSIYLDSSSFNALTNNTCSGDYHSIQLTSSDSNTLTNNTCHDSAKNGIYVTSSSDSNTLTDNTAHSNEYGIVLAGSLFNTLTNNSCYNNTESGIYLYNSNHTTIQKNTCHNNTMYGVHLSYTNSSTLTKNICFDNDNSGIRLELSNSNILVNNTCYLNVWVGIQMGGSNYTILTNNTCYDNIYGIGILSSESNTLTKNTCYNNSEGVYLYRGTFNHLTETICFDNTDFGITLEQSAYNTLTKNTIYENYYGVEVFDTSHKNTLTKNNIYGNTFGIRLSGCWYQLITYCIFSGNGINAEDVGTSNTFDYNYWSDYDGFDSDGDGIGESPYYFTSNSDPHPLVYTPTPPTFLERPEDLIVEFSYSPFQLKLNATCPTAMTWWVSNVLFSIDSQGMITAGFLPIGEHALEVEVSNIYGVRTSVSFSVTVVDTTSPSWLIVPIDQELKYGEEFVYQVAATDLSGIGDWSVNDTTNFSVDEYGVITNNTVLSVGDYALTVTVADTYGNELSSSFTVTVEPLESDTEAPRWIIAPHDLTLSHGEALMYQLAAWDEFGIDDWQLSGSSDITISEDGVITNSSILEIGVYNLEVRAYDAEGNYCSANFTVTVIETEIATTTTTTTTPSGGFEFGFNMSTVGLGVAVFALIIGISAFISARKGS